MMKNKTYVIKNARKFRFHVFVENICYRNFT